MCFACVRKGLASFDLMDCKLCLFFNVVEAHGAGASMYVMILLILRRRPHNNYDTLLHSLLYRGFLKCAVYMYICIYRNVDRERGIRRD